MPKNEGSETLLLDLSDAAVKELIRNAKKRADGANIERVPFRGYPPHSERDADRARRFLQAQRGMGILLLAAR